MTTIGQLDSRALRRVDCYGQRFMKPGEYRYALVPAGTGDAAFDAPFVVVVLDGEGKEGGKEGDKDTGKDERTDDVEARDERGFGQANVVVRADGKRLVAEPATVTVHVGDMVLWNSPDDRPFAVRGAKEFFGSDRLVNESGYSHVFAVPGEVRWTDAYGSGLGGVVRVAEPKVGSMKELDAWRSRLAEGHAVIVADGRAEPAELDVVLGQTVFFVVTEGPGVSITDAALLDGPEPRRHPATKS
jgi:plastocyanin